MRSTQAVDRSSDTSNVVQMIVFECLRHKVIPYFAALNGVYYTFALMERGSESTRRNGKPCTLNGCATKCVSTQASVKFRDENVIDCCHTGSSDGLALT